MLADFIQVVITYISRQFRAAEVSCWVLWSAGEARYTGDEAPEAGELHAAYVQTTIASGRVASVDPAAALAVPGVVAFISADNIAGQNNVCSDGIHSEEVSRSPPPQTTLSVRSLQTGPTQTAGARQTPLPAAELTSIARSEERNL